MSFVKKVMKHASQIEFGRPVEVVPQRQNGIDKWAVLADLTEAAEEFGLNHRTLGVLKALLSFLPGRVIEEGQGRAIVFPSNRTLSARLNGMPESTLRRHLARLVQAGIVSRHDSPNRKRYARRIRGAVALAYGFDLSPLRDHAGRISTAAEAARERRERLAALRDHALALRAALLERAGEGEGTVADEARRLLRRKLDEHALLALIDRLRAALGEADRPVDNADEAICTSEETSGPNARNERHKQDSGEKDSESESHSTRTPTVSKRIKDGICNEEIGLGQVLRTCTSFRSFFPDRVRGWRDLHDIALRIAPMMGIDHNVAIEAQERMGQPAATVAVLCILERMAEIRSPGAYLRRLTQLAEQGKFSVARMLGAVQNPPTAEIVS